MKVGTAPLLFAARPRQTIERWLAPIGVALGYYLAAQAAFAIGTLSDNIFAPFWPPNAVLTCGLLLAPRSMRLAILGATFVAHALAELQVGMPSDQLVVAYLTNCALAIPSALVLQWLSGPPWFGSIRKAAIYIGATAFVIPAVAALGGAFVPIMGGGDLADYAFYWSNWFVGNALASLTIGPMILTWPTNALRTLSTRPIRTWIEPLLFVVALLATCMVSLELSVRILTDAFENAFVPAALYLPLPVILWGSVRFGERGASSAILLLTVVSISLTLNGHSPFVTDRPEKSVLAMQLFLFGVAVPVLLLSAAVEQLKRAEQETRRLAASILRAQDEERRRIARELHDSTAQNLVAASLMAQSAVEHPATALEAVRRIDETLAQSIEDLRLLSYVLHPPQLEEQGLGPAIAEYVRGYSERSGVVVSLDIAGDVGRLPPDAEIAIYRVVQESLANVDRHSGSKTAHVALTRRHRNLGELLTLTIEDSGRGIPQRPLDRSPVAGRGVGLESMRERLAQVGGRLRISSTPGRTIVSAVVPLSE